MMNQNKKPKADFDPWTKEYWDKFFKKEADDNDIECYAEWAQLQALLLVELNSFSKPCADVKILVPGCGISGLSEKLYGEGFVSITNIDFSEVVISKMSKCFPLMGWKNMDMTCIQFKDKSFNVVLDKGGLDLLMEPEFCPTLGNQYASEVKRVLTEGGKFVCLTLGESHVLGRLFPKFRYGWKITIHLVPQKESGRSNLRIFMVVAEKTSPILFPEISFSWDTLGDDDQAKGINAAVKTENQFKKECSVNDPKLYTLEDLKTGVIGDISQLFAGRRVEIILNDAQRPHFFKSVLLDAMESGNEVKQFGVFIVEKPCLELELSSEAQWELIKDDEWERYSEIAQWESVKKYKLDRLLMVFCDATHTGTSLEELQKDVEGLAFRLAPTSNCSKYIVKPEYWGIKTFPRDQKELFRTGKIQVVDSASSKKEWYRELTFERSEQSSQSTAKMLERDHVDHQDLQSSYHLAIISGFILMTAYLEKAVKNEEKVMAVVIGLGAGLVPMFLNECFKFLQLQVAELHQDVVDIAENYFGFTKNKLLKVHVIDGIKFVGDLSTKVDILIVDVYSSDSSSGMICPAEDFVERSFLEKVKESLSDESLFVINLVSRSPTMKKMVISRMKEVFSRSKLFSLKVEEDVNEVIYVCNAKGPMNISSKRTSDRFKLLLKGVTRQETRASIHASAMNIKSLDD